MADEPIYQQAFQNSRPTSTFSAVQSRLSLSRALTQDLASYYAERAAVEDAYVKSLQKLSSRLHGSPPVLGAVEQLGLGRDEGRQLGGWKALLARVEGEVGETARVHEVFRKRVEEEVAAPLRASLGKGDWSKWGTMEQQLGATVKDYEKTLDKVQQAQQKGTKSSKSAQSKLLTSQSHLSQLGSTLTTSLPSFLAQSQSLDRAHAAFLKESLVRHGTISSDLGRERMEMGERLLVGVFEVDELAEMQGWALKEGQKTATGGGGGGLNGSGAGTTGHLNEFGSLGRASGSPRTESIAEEREGQMLPPPVPSSRERQSSNARQPPPVAPVPVPTAATSAVKSGGSKLKGLFKRDRSSSAAGSSKYGNLDGPALGSSTNVGHPPDRVSIASSRDHEVESLAEQPEQPSALPSFNRSISSASSGMGNMPPPIQPDKTPKKRDSLMPFSNGGPGGLFRRASKLTGAGGGSPAVSPAATERAEPRLAESPMAGNVDEEGFSVPPAGYDRQPWEQQQQQNPSSGANLMDDSDDEGADGLGTITPASKLPSVALAPATITETNEDRAAALAKVQSALLSSPPSSGATSPLGGLAAPPATLGRRTTRGRRDVRMTMYQPGSSTDDMPLANLQQRARQQSGDTSGSAVSPPISPIPTGTSAFGEPGRANSILSTTSASTAARAVGGARDPFEGVTAPGLRASIVETVNVLSKGGEVSRVMIQGEISLSHRPAASGAEPVRIRITNFEQFEKAAPNAAFIQPLADAPGEYTLLPSLAQHGATATVLKYQVFVAPGQEAFFTPLHVKAAWKTEPTLTRVMVTFEPNPSAVFAGKASSAEASPFGEDDEAAVQLEDVAFLLPVNTSVSTFQAKPSATWSAEKRRLGFSVEPVRLSGEVGESKLLASLTTEGQASAQPVAVRWRVVGRTVSAVGLEVVGGGGGQGEGVEEVRRATVTGKYLVAP